MIKVYALILFLMVSPLAFADQKLMPINKPVPEFCLLSFTDIDGIELCVYADQDGSVKWRYQ